MKALTPDSTVRDLVTRGIEIGFFNALQDIINCARHNPGNTTILGIDQFDRDILPFLRLIGGKSESIPKELEPPWLAEIEAILNRVAPDLVPPESPL